MGPRWWIYTPIITFIAAISLVIAGAIEFSRLDFFDPSFPWEFYVGWALIPVAVIHLSLLICARRTQIINVCEVDICCMMFTFHRMTPYSKEKSQECRININLVKLSGGYVSCLCVVICDPLEQQRLRP